LVALTEHQAPQQNDKNYRKRHTADGIPVPFILDGRTWHVGAEPVR
jgi:hypothetical protein